MPRKNTQVAIIGAGPYGLSIAAYLRHLDIDFRLFGTPMETWRDHMPPAMRLKSEGMASTLYDPTSSFTLGHYCRERDIPYADIGLPVALETFVAYGLAFQQRFVPHLENIRVVLLEKTRSGFRLELEGGEEVFAQRVVLATGISDYAHIPPPFSDLPRDLVSHTADYSAFDQFRDREVVVIGSGASAVDVAAALHQAGAKARLVARKPTIHFHNPPAPLPRPLRERIQAPMTGLGPGWRSFMCIEGPLVFRCMPLDFRLKVVQKHLGPSPGWFVRDQVVGKVPFLLGMGITGVTAAGSRVRLNLSGSDGSSQTIEADHVIAGTGYKVDLHRLRFLDPVRSQIRSVENTPVLSSVFESSIPDLYFTGASSANTFGPLVRFALGAGFTAKRLTKHLVRIAARKSRN